ncbi:VOC family protein [Streptacidiphilus fuscans]|uniref:VOC family protein n=1 Tax=Streptacidiphilus fuscans TaxID=2789292 RepID=A0A931FFY7_9ACTN|nr:VOC family protein [Streptacidiphilus fuscans]MBF9070356.1 VOC family protein [Streptacidiphilus fuscans]
MIGNLRAFALDCPDPVALAGFYAQLVGGKVVVEEEQDEWVELEGDYGTTKLAFQKVDGYRAPAWPGQGTPQQAHIDIGVTDLDAAHTQVLALGATPLEDWAGTKSWRVYADPVGHPFCLCAC